MNSKKRYMVIALLALLVVSAMAYNDEAKPWTFWNWKYGSVSRPGIHADLTGMKNVGMGGIWLMPVREAGECLEFQDGVAQLSPEFWKMMDYSFLLADSLDFDMGIHVLPGNPLVLPAESMQKVVWTDTIMKGGKKIEGLQMWQPESYKDGKMQSAGSEGGYYQDIALCYRSLVNNRDGRYGTTHPYFDADALFNLLGIEPDRDKLFYYTMLDELF